TKCFAFVGDSTFFASAVTGAINGVYNQADMTLVVLDNSTTAMTGHQPHPGTGKTMMGEVNSSVDIDAVLKGVGVETVEHVDPLDLENAVSAVKKVADMPGVKAIIFESPCAMLFKPEKPYSVDRDKCIDCRMCIKEIGCPGLVISDGHVVVDTSLCNGCGLCSKICPVDAIGKEVQV
ncbi:MAG: 4Fe-4S binding protein, partial [Clostridiales bacterium]|nr:4Fe-4S binding protein [Clostridiales bacterium]